MHSNGPAITFALISAVLIAVGTVWRHRILRAGQARSEANTAPLKALANPSWWLSIAIAFLAYGFQAAALAYGSLLVVQPILVLSLMLTLLLSARVAHQPMSRAQVLWAAVLTISVAVVVILGRPLPGTREVAAWEWVAVCGIGIACLVAVFAFAYRRPPATAALTFGLACGAIYGYLAVFAKAAMDTLADSGWPAMLSGWQFWAVIVSAVLGIVVQQYAFGAGDLTTSLPASKVAEPMAALLIGYTLLGEEFGVDGWGLGLIGASIGMMLLSAVKLTRASLP